MKKRCTYALALLAALAVGVQAEVTLRPAENNTDPNKVYTFVDVTAVPLEVTGNAATVTGIFGAPGFGRGEGTFTITVDGLFAYTQSVAQVAVGAGTFGDYLAGLQDCDIDNQVTRWGVDSTAYQVDPDTTRLSINEAIVYTFDLSGLTKGDFELHSITPQQGGGSELLDLYLYNPASNTVEQVLNQGTGGQFSFTNSITDGCQFIMGSAAANSLRIESINFNITSELPTNLAPPFITDVSVQNSRVNLDWPDAVNPFILDTFNVYRSLNETNGFSVVASMTNSAYVDTAVTNDVPYYYYVTAVYTNSVETSNANTVVATPIVTIPEGLTADAGNLIVNLDWDDNATNDLYFGDYSVYRSYVPSNYTAIASNLTDSSFTDTNLFNDLIYYYVVTMVATNPYGPTESPYSGSVNAEPSDLLIARNYTVNNQGEIRSFVTTTNSLWEDEASDTRVQRTRVRASNNAGIERGDDFLSRTVLGWPLVRSDLGNRTTNDIESVTFRFWILDDGWMLTNSPLPFSSIEVYHSSDRNGDIKVGLEDWRNDLNDGWTLVGAVPGLTNGATANMFEIDVTAEVLEDLSQNNQDGVSLQVRGYDDINFDTNLFIVTYGPGTNELGVLVTNYLDTGIEMYQNGNNGDNIGATLGYYPQLRVKFQDNRSGYLQWTDNFLPTVIGPGSDDYDGDGVNNETEYGLNGDPTDSGDVGYESYLTADGKYIHAQLGGAGDDNLTYTVQINSDLRVLGGWTDTTLPVLGTGTDGAGAGYDVVTNSVSTAGDEQFIRLIVEQIVQ